MNPIDNINEVINDIGIRYSKQVSDQYTKKEIIQLSKDYVEAKEHNTAVPVAFNFRAIILFEKGAAIYDDFTSLNSQACFITKKEFHEIIQNEKLEIVFKAMQFKRSNRQDQATSLLTKESKKGCKHSQLSLGIEYMTGSNMPANKNKAIKYLKLAARQGVVKANTYLAEIYFKDQENQLSYKKAFDYCAVASNGGDFNAQFLFGQMYYHFETPNPKNQSKALELYTSAASNGHISANFALGNLYFEAIYIERDLKKSFQHYKIAADQGHPDAQFFMGVAYLEGYGVDKDIPKAISLWFQSAHNGCEEAIFALKNNNLM